MAGETQRMCTVQELDAEFKQQDERTALEPQINKTTKESSEHFSSTGTEARLSSTVAKPEKLEKERDCPQQREAVIRPQQAGKIDFRSLQKQSKFATDRTWSSGKGSPQSPSGKGRSREKAKRSGKTERGNPQQLYRLSIANPRTIGIAYPQQKVLPPKKLETSCSPVSGSQRFHVPSIPEREVDLQQEKLNYSRCFQENNITSPSYTSQALGSSSETSSYPHQPLSQQQQLTSMENSNAQRGSQLILPDFQLGGSNVWQSPDRTFNGASYGVSSQKSTALSETSKANNFVPVPFQYGYQLMEDSTSDSFSCEQNPHAQDFTNSSLGPVHAGHNSLSLTPAEGQNIAQSSTQFSCENQPDDRSAYPQPPHSQFIQGAASSIQCPRNLSEDSASSDSSSSSSQQSEQGKTALPDATDSIVQADTRDAAITMGSKRNCHPKDTAICQRTHSQGGVHARNSPSSPMHFSNRTFNNPVGSIHTNPMSFDKNISTKVVNRLQHTWEGTNKAYSSADQNMVQYTDMNEKFQFQNQTIMDQRPSKSSRMPWQQIRSTSAISHPNRIELSRQMSNQKLAYIVSPSEWQDESKSHKPNPLKTSNSFHNNRCSDGFSTQRQETVKHNNNTVSTFKVEMSHTQVCDSKSKAVYFGLNQSLPTVPSRNYSYPPLQVPPMGLMMVSPYESPLPSPVHNPASSSTCSSLSPASTSPVNINSEDNQLSKSAHPHPFYHQPPNKTQLTSDHLSTHTFHPDAPRALPYAPDRSKDEMISYLQNSTPPKPAMDGNKGYMDSFGMEHHQPPPPYSAHQLLASSLATANLDQLDVLLTCKQCDQNFNNLASFLNHKQYCSQHTFAHNDLKDISKIEDNRKFHTEPVKAVSAVSNISLSRCPSDLHLSLLGLNKNGELMSDNETKGDSKDDPLKLNLFSSPSNIPVALPELELEDAKLDSLITEALNGLGYQSDNAEIDSSFIDAFVDDDLTTVKTSSNKQCLKTKESLIFESKNKQAIDDKSFIHGKAFYDSDGESHKKMAINSEQDEKINIKKEVSNKNSRLASREKMWEQESKMKDARKLCKSEEENTSTQRFLLSRKFSEHYGMKSFQDNAALRGSAPSQSSTSPTSRAAAKESKRKNAGGGTWSKELIHKIVQQKNKLHKLHVKGTKNLQFSLVMERLTPTVQNPAFGEYDYVSDSDDECEPVKIASQGRLNQSSRCKYTYTKECKWRARSERDQAAWRHESKECFEVKKSELSLSPEKPSSHQRLRRRGSRSSTSSDLSTSVSVSSDGINSPKSTDRTDSDSEKKTEKKKESPEQKTYDRSSPQKVFKESSTLALTFTKSIKKYTHNKALHSQNKDTSEYANTEIADSVSSSQKARHTLKNFDKRESSHTKSRETLASHKKEVCSEKNTQMKTKDDQMGGTDKKTLQFDSHLHTITTDRNTKEKRAEGLQAAQSELSATNTLEKQSNNVCMGNEAAALVNDLDTRKAAPLCPSLMNEVCMSPPQSQKDALHLMPYPLDQEQGLMKSPLSFDTSSMFGDLTGFDSGLYSEMPIQKEAFPLIESTANKKEECSSSFSPFLEQRDWNLIVSPVLPDEISQYKSNSEKLNEKKADYNHVPLSLPEKIIDYSANLNSCASEDELEIKRIVNELENQLQTTKLESPPLLPENISKDLQMSKFSPLRPGHESELKDDHFNRKCSEQAINVSVSKMASESFVQPALPWQAGFQFELITDDHSEPLEHQRLRPDQKPKKSLENETLEETKDILEERQYTENLMRSLEVISDSIFKKQPIISVHNKPNVTTLTSQQHEESECQPTDAVEQEDLREKEAITGKENISSLPNINEPKDEIEFILSESQSSLSKKTDPSSVSSNKPVSSQPSELTESSGYKAETKVTTEECIAERSHLTAATPSSSVTTHDQHEVKTSCGNNNVENSKHELIENNSDGTKYSPTDGWEEAEAVKGITPQSKDHPLTLAFPDPSRDIGEKVADVMKTAMKKQSADEHDNHQEISQSHPGENITEKVTVEISKKDSLTSLSPSKISSPSNAFNETNLSDKLSSPILMETKTENCCSPLHNIQSTEGQSNLLMLSPSDGIINSNPCKMTPFNDSLESEVGLIYEPSQKQEEILNVQDIKEHLPADFMASEQNSPCREEVQESQRIFSDCAAPISPLSSSHQKATAEEELYKSKDTCQDTTQNAKFSIGKEESLNTKESVNGDKLNQAEVSFSLISTPQLDLGMEDTIPSSETVPSSLPVNNREPPEVMASLEKSDLIYNLKLSPLNYSSIADEPPQLNQYHYMPVSPPSKPDKNLDTKERPGNHYVSCDLNVNPALILNETETVTALPLNPDSKLKLDLLAEPLVLQKNTKFTSFALEPPTDVKQTDFSSVDGKKSLEVFHEPLQSVEHLHMHADLMSQVETKKLYEVSAEASVPPQKSFSDGPPTLKPLIICENKQTAPLLPAEKLPTIKLDHQLSKETTPKHTQSNAQAGKVLCEICLLCFRTVPGLKRHKAMKHSLKSGQQKTRSNHEGTRLVCEGTQTTEKNYKNDTQACFQTKIEVSPEISNPLTLKTPETESVLQETETFDVRGDEIGHQNHSQPVKTKKKNKAKKNKNWKLSPGPFSDEILNMLKTDILQAITPEFKSTAPQEPDKSPQQMNDTAVVGKEEFPASDSDISPTKKTYECKETTALNQIANTEVMTCTSTTKMANSDVCANNGAESLCVQRETEIGCEEPGNAQCTVKKTCEPEDSLAQEILRKVSADIKCEKNRSPADELHPLSDLNSPPLSPPTISPELRALLDDDTTFSQLFPRDEEAKRKKCPRVYSKKNKRQKISTDSDVTIDYVPPETCLQNKSQYVEVPDQQKFKDNQTNHCEYETISLDDAIMLNMCHNSSLKADGEPMMEVVQKEHGNVCEVISEAEKNPLNPLENSGDNSAAEWIGSNDFSGLHSCPTACSESNMCKSEAPPCPVPSQAPPYTIEPHVEEGVQTFHNIDIQNINTTFQLPEIQFFDLEKDVSVALPSENTDLENKEEDKLKKVTERRGRKRQDGGMKVKDKQYKCKVCFTWFLTLGELNFHKLSHNPSPPPTCYMCVQRKFSSREQLRDHLREKHARNKTGIWTCGMCLKEISDVWMYNEHLREHATQFARRGQTQGSMLGISGCYMQETAVKNFLSSIMHHRSTKGNRESSRTTKDQEKSAAGEVIVIEGKTSEGAEPKVHKTKSSTGVSGKQNTLTPLEVLHKTETHKSVEMHPNCKDPSRDCHHCGKQFPKPFKLQRHLVVHNLEKIFLCHKCPVSYQEVQELKDHLKRAHEEVDEQDSKHTTLYTCELCADVMHVIKKSFICSTCNYTFSKKEQFDRHMEKHLSGGNKIFKFRGVLRPVRVSVSKENECDSPASKKRRILSDSLAENSSDSGIASVSSLHLNQSAETLSSKPSTADDSTQTTSNEYQSNTNNTNVKTEDIAEDYSELLVELEKCVHLSSPTSVTPKEEEIEPASSSNLDKENNKSSVGEDCDVKEEDESVSIREEWAPSKECGATDIFKSKEGDTSETEKKMDSSPTCENSFVNLRENQNLLETPESAKHVFSCDEVSQLRNDEQWHHILPVQDNEPQVLFYGAELESDSQIKDNVSATTTMENSKNWTMSSTKETECPPVLHSKGSPNISKEEKDSVRPQKKRKEIKSTHALQRVSSPVTQENFGIDSKVKKKVRSSKCTNTPLQRKSDGATDYPVLSSVRDDAVSNKIVSKCKTVNMSLQTKRSLLESCTQKKTDIVTSQNGDYKARKGPLGRSLHTAVSKVSSVPMNNYLNKSRPKMGVRSVDSHSYRTAESQNNLLSQLFGQKLTSFKIPLRKDTSESIN